MNFISLSFLGFGVVLFALWWALPARSCRIKERVF